MDRIISSNGKKFYNEYICDTIEDLKSLNVKDFGDTVYVIDTKDKYILNSKFIWVCMTSNKESVPSCNCVEESTIWDELA